MKVIIHPRVESQIRDLSDDISAEVFSIINLFSGYYFKLPSPYLKKIRTGIWELRVKRYRLLLGQIGAGSVIVVLFFKQTQKTPKKYIKLAISRLNQYEK